MAAIRGETAVTAAGGEGGSTVDDVGADLRFDELSGAPVLVSPVSDMSFGHGSRIPGAVALELTIVHLPVV